jgi:hypothetical protein
MQSLRLPSHPEMTKPIPGKEVRPPWTLLGYLLRSSTSAVVSHYPVTLTTPTALFPYGTVRLGSALLRLPGGCRQE